MENEQNKEMVPIEPVKDVATWNGFEVDQDRLPRANKTIWDYREQLKAKRKRKKKQSQACV